MNTSSTERPWILRTLDQLGRDLGYLLPLLPITVVSFSVMVTLVATSAGLLIIWVGVPLGVATLWVARALANLERARLGALGHGDVIGVYAEPAPDASRMRRLFHPFTDPQPWKDIAHAILTFPVAVFSWSVTITWVAAVLSGLTYWFWGHWVPNSDVPDVWILETITAWHGQLILGILALVSLPFVARGLAAMHLAIGRGLLGSSEERRLRAEVARLESQRGAAASAESTSLRRIERDLHDGPQQRLIRLQMEAQLAERTLEADPEAARAALASVREQSQEALAELRALTRGFAPPLLAERGLVAAVESLAERSTVPVAVTAELDRAVGVAAETAAYFVVAEALANVAKHAEATRAAVSLSSDGTMLRVEVADDGKGGAHAAKGHGLAGLEERVAGAGGSLAVTDAPGGGTVLTATVPAG